MDRPLIDDRALAGSSVVANNAMNRERGLSGPNSYAREMGFDPLDWLLARGGGAWLDMCCGSGRALLDAADRLRGEGLAGRFTLVGVDLVDFFAAPPAPPLDLVCAPIGSWTPARRFDLITCVHGLHYVGDKLAVLTRAAGWLTGGGLLVADLDLAGVRLRDGRPAGRALASALRRAGFGYDGRRRRVTRTGPADVSLPYAYLGADDRAGPNYTNQPAVHSYYERQATST